MALRTEASASSGRTRIAGGGWWPIRCSAASTSASTSRRSASEARSAVSFSPRAAIRRSVSAIWPSSVLDALVGVEEGLVEGGAVLVEGLDLGLEFGHALVAEGDAALDRGEFGPPGVGVGGRRGVLRRRPGRAAATSAAASQSLIDRLRQNGHPSGRPSDSPAAPRLGGPP